MFSFFKKKPALAIALHAEWLEVKQKNTKGLARGEASFENPDDLEAALYRVLTDMESQIVFTNRAVINIPFDSLYPFMKDFPHRISETSMRADLASHIQAKSPVSSDDLSLIYSMKESGHITTYGAVGFTKKWQQNIQKICKKFGLKYIEFIPEPLAQLALLPDAPVGDFALFSRQGSAIQASLFHNGLLYDVFTLTYQPGKTLDTKLFLGEIDCALQELKVAFSVRTDQVFFAGFKSHDLKTLSESLRKKNIEAILLDSESPTLDGLLKISQNAS